MNWFDANFVIQYGALGGLLLVVWAFVYKIIPKFIDSFTEALREERESYARRLEAVEVAINENSKCLAKLSALIVIHHDESEVVDVKLQQVISRIVDEK